MRVWYIPTLDCGARFANYYKAVRKEEVARRRSSCCKRVWTGLVEPVGKAGRQGGVRWCAKGVVVGRTRRRRKGGGCGVLAVSQ